MDDMHVLMKFYLAIESTSKQLFINRQRKLQNTTQAKLIFFKAETVNRIAEYGICKMWSI